VRVLAGERRALGGLGKLPGRCLRRSDRGRAVISALLVIGLSAACRQGDCPETREHAPEATMRADLQFMRRAIGDFQKDKGRCPASLEELIQAKYLRKIPVDPVTRSERTWQCFECQVRSGASGKTCSGEPWSSLWEATAA